MERMSAGLDRRGRRWRLWLWGVALLLMLAAAVYQRRTGPSYPLRGEVEVAGESFIYELVRSGISSEGARVSIPEPEGAVTARLHYRRFKTDDPFTTVELRSADDQLVADLPGQPAAGKLEYYISLDLADGRLRIPDPGRGTAVIRFKNDVPVFVLLPHVVFMFLAMLVGVRAGLGAVFATADARRLAWTALGLMTVGGLVLGPIVQKYAFGAFWTGFPFGRDLTDNKVLIMWLVWLAACLFVGIRGFGVLRRERVALALAALVMLVVYVIPHSAQGSELDWEQVERGVPPEEAVETGPDRRQPR